MRTPPRGRLPDDCHAPKIAYRARRAPAPGAPAGAGVVAPTRRGSSRFDVPCPTAPPWLCVPIAPTRHTPPGRPLPGSRVSAAPAARARSRPDARLWSRSKVPQEPPPRTPPRHAPRDGTAAAAPVTSTPRSCARVPWRCVGRTGPLRGRRPPTKPHHQSGTPTEDQAHTLTPADLPGRGGQRTGGSRHR